MLKNAIRRLKENADFQTASATANLSTLDLTELEGRICFSVVPVISEVAVPIGDIGSAVEAPAPSNVQPEAAEVDIPLTEADGPSFPVLTAGGPGAVNNNIGGFVGNFTDPPSPIKSPVLSTINTSLDGGGQSTNPTISQQVDSTTTNDELQAPLSDSESSTDPTDNSEEDTPGSGIPELDPFEDSSEDQTKEDDTNDDGNFVQPPEVSSSGESSLIVSRFNITDADNFGAEINQPLELLADDTPGTESNLDSREPTIEFAALDSQSQTPQLSSSSLPFVLNATTDFEVIPETVDEQLSQSQLIMGYVSTPYSAVSIFGVCWALKHGVLGILGSTPAWKLLDTETLAELLENEDDLLEVGS